MILSSEEIESRLAHPENLINRLRALSKGQTIIPSVPSGLSSNEEAVIPSIPSADDLIPSLDDKLDTARGYSGAKRVLGLAVAKLEQRLNEVDKPTDLSRIVLDMGRVVNGFDDKAKVNQPQNIIIYRPTMNTESIYGDVVHANE